MESIRLLAGNGAHTGRITKEVNEGIIFKSMSRIKKNQNVIVKYPVTGSNGKSQGVGVT